MGRKVPLQSVVVGLLIGCGCIAILWRQVALRQSWTALTHLNGPLLLIPLALSFVNFPLRAWRWDLLFSSATRPGFASCLSALGIGNMANFLLPARAGDLARCVLAGREGSVASSARTLATLAVEKVLDGLALVAMVLFAIWALRPPGWVLNLVRMAAVIFGGALLLLVLLRYRTRFVINPIRRVFRFVHLSRLEESFDGLLTSFADGLQAVSSAGRMLVLLLLTGFIWVAEAASIWGLALAMGLGVGLKSAVVASAILGLGLMIPAAPGGLGTYELFGTEAFKLTGVAASSALALTIVIHAWVFVINIALGLILLAAKGTSLAQLSKALGSKAAPVDGSESAVQTSSVRPLN